MKIAFIGFGEAARAFAETLGREDDRLVFSAYDILTAGDEDRDLRAAALKLGVAIAESPGAAIDGADWIFSAVTAADSLDAARSVAAAIAPGQLFIDINSVSAGRKIETAAIIKASGASYLDMAVMAPVHPRGHRTQVLVAGPDARSAAAVLDRLGFDHAHAGNAVGDATTIKMLRSLFVKGLEAITVQTLLAAKTAGRYDEVYASLSSSFAALGWPKFPLYQLERVATHGVRRAAEMRESARTLAELGFPEGSDLANAIADIQQSIGDLGISAGMGEEVSAAYEAVEKTSREKKRRNSL